MTRPDRSSTATATSPTATTGRRSTAPCSRASGSPTTCSGNGRSIAFGGFGRYYDRVLYDWTLAERARLQYATRTFQFSQDGGIRDGVQTIVWDPSYLSRAGLDSLIARGIAPAPEVHLMDNEVKPPVSNQWSLGFRQKMGTIVASATYSGTRTQNILTFIRGNRRPDGTCCLTVPGYSGIIVADLEGREAWFDALYLQAERPFGTGRQALGLQLHLHARRCPGKRRRPVQPRLPDGRGLSRFTRPTTMSVTAS